MKRTIEQAPLNRGYYRQIYQATDPVARVHIDALFEKASAESRGYSVLFRGHADARFALLPSAQRPRWNTVPTNQDQVSYELEAIQNVFWLADRCGLALPEDFQIHRRDLFSDVSNYHFSL